MKILTLPAADPLATKPNFAGLDAVRAFAAIGVVLLHSCVPYLTHPMPGLAWSVRDNPSDWVDVVFWSMELFIMPLFLVMAGFFAWQTLQRRGPRELVRQRAGRLLLPLLFGVLVVLPLDLYSWVLGWVAEGWVAPVKLKSLKFDGQIDRDLWGLSHLWFLQYLFLYVAVLAAAVATARRFTRSLLTRSLLTRSLPARSLLTRSRRVPPHAGWWAAATFVVAAAVLTWRPEVVWGFQHQFLPVPSKWAYSGMFFCGGVLLGSHDPQLRWLCRHAPRLTPAAVMLAAAAVTLGRWHLGNDPAAGPQSQLAAPALAVLTTAAATGITISVLGISVRWVRRVPVSVSYLAAASFWIYLVHHPLLGIVHLDLKWLLPGTGAVLKTAVALTISVGVSLLTYEGLVRRSRLGHWLGFQWSPPSDRATGDDPVVVRIDRQPTDKTAVDRGRRAA